jgi:uncharacterized protein (TIGR01777 family)
MEKVLIAGGSGLIGRELTSVLVNNGYEVAILSRNPEAVTGIATGVKLVRWNGITPKGWDAELENTAAIVNLTGENLAGSSFFPARWTDERKRRIIQSRVDAGKAIAEAIKESSHKPAVLIQASSIGFYGISLDKSFTEEDKSGTDFLAEICREWEASSASIDALGVRRVVIRTGVVLTTKGGALPRLLLPYRLFLGGPMGTGRQILSWLHIADEVNAIRFLIENDDVKGIINLTSPNPVTNNEFGKMIGKVMRKPHFIPVPGFVLKIVFGEVSTVVLDGQRVLPKRLLDSGYIFKYTMLEDALRDLLSK